MFFFYSKFATPGFNSLKKCLKLSSKISDNEKEVCESLISKCNTIKSLLNREKKIQFVK